MFKILSQIVHQSNVIVDGSTLDDGGLMLRNDVRKDGGETTRMHRAFSYHIFGM